MQATRWQILENLKKQGRMSVDELARALELTSNCIRQHLTLLERDSFVVSAPDRTTMGRPRQLFSLTPTADDLFPKNYHNLIDWLFTEIELQDGQKKLFNLLDSIAERVGAVVAERVKDAPFAQKVAAVSEFLNNLGEITEWQLDEKGYILYSYNCTYARISPKHKEICRLDQGLIAAITGVKAMRLEIIANGDPRCAFLLLPTENSVPLEVDRDLHLQ